jgi:hypothetical protein
MKTVACNKLYNIFYTIVYLYYKVSFYLRIDSYICISLFRFESKQPVLQQLALVRYLLGHLFL